jgi:hypothetical protein
MEKVVPQISIGELEGLKVIITHVRKMVENQLGFQASFSKRDNSPIFENHLQKLTHIKFLRTNTLKIG